MRRTLFAALAAVVCLCVLPLAGSTQQPANDGESLAKESKALVEKVLTEIIAEKDQAKQKQLQEKYEAQFKAMEARVKKLSAEEKKRFDAFFGGKKGNNTEASPDKKPEDKKPDIKKDKGKPDKKPALPQVSIAPGQGEQKKPITVTLKFGEGAVIRYTLDGTAPTGPDAGLPYKEPMAVSKTTTITAVAFKNGELVTQPVSNTYLFDPKQGLSTFHIGNSLTNTTGQFPNLAKTAGINHKYQSFTAGGALTKKLWDIDMVKQKDKWDKTLASTPKFDIFTVQPRNFDIDREADHDIKFFNLIRKHSPDFQPWLYCEWVEKDRKRPTDLGKVRTSQMKMTYPALTWEESMAAMLLYVEELQLKIGETYKEGKKPRVLPSSIAMGWIHNMIEKGKFGDAKPGSFYPLLFSDGVHPNVNGAFLVDCTWYAAFYRESPEGKFLPVGTKLSAEQAKIMQRLAWDVVKNYPDAGLYEEGTTPVGTPVVTYDVPLADRQPMTLTSPTPGAWFRYTMDGTTPTRTKGYVYCGVISARPGTTLKAVAFKSGMADSAVTEVKIK